MSLYTVERIISPTIRDATERESERDVIHSRTAHAHTNQEIQ